MNNILPQELLSMWEKGISLDKAPKQFCDTEIWQKYNQISSALTEYSDNSKSSGWDGIQKMAQAAVGKQSARDNLYANLFNKLASRKLIAVGYESPMKTSDFPKIISVYMWPPEKKDIYKSSISKNGISFLEVRIIKKLGQNKIIRKKEIVPPKVPIIDKNVGRPSLKKEITSAYEYLKKHGCIDYSKFLKSHTDLIQDTVMQLFPNITTINGMEHEAIRRILTERFKADKKTSKLTSKL